MRVRFKFNRGKFKAGEEYDLPEQEAEARLKMGEVERVGEPTIDELGDTEIVDTGPPDRETPTETTERQLPGLEEAGE